MLRSPLYIKQAPVLAKQKELKCYIQAYQWKIEWKEKVWLQKKGTSNSLEGTTM